MLCRQVEKECLRWGPTTEPSPLVTVKWRQEGQKVWAYLCRSHDFGEGVGGASFSSLSQLRERRVEGGLAKKGAGFRRERVGPWPQVAPPTLSVA